MKIVRSIAKEACPGILDCPEVLLLEDRRAVVRGYRIDSDTRGTLGMPDNEDAVIVPMSLLLRAALRRWMPWT